MYAILTPSEAVLLNGNDFTEKIPGYKVIIGRVIFGLVFIALGLFMGYFSNKYDGQAYFIVLFSCILFVVVGIAICFSNYSASENYAPLPDGKTWVNSNLLGRAIIKAAVLSNIDGGYVKAEIAANGELVLQATGLSPVWPADTLEARLDFEAGGYFSDILKEWFATKSKSPWIRVITMCEIMLVVRGFLVMVNPTRGNNGSRYNFTPNKIINGVQEAKEQVEALFAKYHTSNTVLMSALETSISTAIAELTYTVTGPNDKFEEPDPWKAEINPESYLPPPGDGFFDQLIGKLFGLTAAVVLFVLTWYNSWIIYCMLVSFIVCLWQAALLLPINYFRERRKKLIRNVKNPGNMPWYQENPPKGSMLKFFFNLAAIFIIVSIVLAGCCFLYQYKHIIGYAALGLILLLAYGYLQQITGQKISAAVSAAPMVNENTTTAPPLAGQGVTSPNGSARASFRINKKLANELPPVTQEVEKLYDAIYQRGPAINLAYKKGIGALLLFTILLVWIFYLAHKGESDAITDFAVPESVFGAFTLFYLFNKTSSKHISYLIAAAVLKASEIEVDGATGNDAFDPDNASSLRCRRLFFIGLFWLGAVLINLRSVYLGYGPKNFLNIICVVLTVLSIASYIVWIHYRKTAIEKQYTLQQPYHLLALRVFSASNIGNFIDLIDKWKYFGSRSQLDGPDTVGHKVKDVINYFRGKIQDSIVSDDAQLEKTLNSFKYGANKSLRFGVNDMQCTNATWKKAIQAMFKKADVVVMDMSAISQQNKGIAYELGKVINEFPLQRVVMLIDHNTDESALNELLTQVCSNIAETSPNYGQGLITINLLDTGGHATKEATETEYDLRKRLHKRIDQKQLISLLLTAAQPRINTTGNEQSAKVEHIRWADPFVSKHPQLWNAIALVTLIALIGWIIVSAYTPVVHS